MKQIKLTHFNNPNKNSIYTRDHCYSVWLGNETKRSFSDRKKMEHFFVRVNNDLNICLVEIIAIYTDLHFYYWQTWFYDYVGKNKLNHIDGLLNIAVDRSHHTNGNYFVFVHLNNALQQLEEIAKELVKFRAEKNHYSEVRQLNSLLYRIDNCYAKLKLIGKT